MSQGAALEVAGVVTTIGAELAPLKAGFAEAVNDAKTFSATINANLEHAADLRPKATELKEQVELIKDAKKEIEGVKDEGAKKSDFNLGDPKTIKEHISLLGEVKDKLEEVRRSAGKRSGIGELFEALKGAGAIAGLAVVGEIFAQAATKAGEIQKKFREGQLDWKGVGHEIASSIPVLGQMVEGFDAIRESVTHEKEILEDVNASIEAGNIATEARKKIVDDLLHAQEEFRDITREINHETSLLGQTGPKKEKMQIGFEYDDRKLELAKKLKEDLDAAKEEARKATEEIREKLKPIKLTLDAGGLKGDDWISLFKAWQDGENLIKNLNDAARDRQGKLQAAYDEAVKGLGDLKAKQDEVIPEVVEGLDDLRTELEKIGKTDEQKKIIDLRNMGASLWDMVSAAGTLAQIKMAGWAEKASQSIEEARHQLAELRAESTSEKMLIDFKGTGQQRQEITELGHAIDDATKANKWKDEIKEFAKSIETPIQRFKELHEELKRLREEKLITDAQFKAGEAKIESEAREATIKKAVEEANANAEARFAEFGANTNETAKYAIDNERQQTAIDVMKQQLSRLDKIITNTSRQDYVVEIGASK